MKKAVCRMLWQQSWLGLRLKKSIHRYLKELGETPDAPFVTDFFGMRYEGNLNNGIEFAIYYYGAFEKPLLFFLRDTAKIMADRLNTRLCFCDVGSNVGQHSLFMSRYAAQVHAFEPFDAVRQQLERHITLNDIRNIQVHPLGLGERDEELTFHAPTGSNKGIGSFIEDSQRHGTEAIGKLKVVRADRYFADTSIDAVQLIKIDVEGFEKPVLHGMQTMLARLRPLVVCEVSYGGSSSFSSIDEFRAALPKDYRLYQFNKRKADGSEARRRGSLAKRSGKYKLVPFNNWLTSGQDDIILVPHEFLPWLPMGGT